MTTPDWQTRRSRFNHDWLKNQFLPALDNFLNILDGRVENRALDVSFVVSALSAWERHKAEAMALPADFEQGMSPRNLFNQPPLSNCDDETRQWLGDVMHQLWLVRYSVPRLVAEASKSACAVDCAYRRLKIDLAECEGRWSAGSSRELRQSFAEFRKACYRLARAIEQFACEVRVT